MRELIQMASFLNNFNHSSIASDFLKTFSYVRV